jgi:hypothetical protein
MEPPPVSSPKARPSSGGKCAGTRDWYNFSSYLVLLALCVAASAARWLVMDTLLIGDSGRWLFEVFRASCGELPYRDFAWQYPPLSLFLVAAAFRGLGATFATAQIVLDLLSCIIVLLSYRAAARLLPRPLDFFTAFAIFGIGATSGSEFALFSLMVYTPAVLTGAAGALLAATAIIDAYEKGAFSSRSGIEFAVGANTAILSKPEYAVGIIAAFVAFVLASILSRERQLLVDRPGRVVAVLSAGFAPSIAFYIVLASVVGGTRLVDGLSGYGLASALCPWWPTGIGLYGATAALGGGATLIAAASMPSAAALWRRFGIAYWAFLLLSLASFVVFLAYLPIAVADLNASLGRAKDDLGIRSTVSYLASTKGVLLPVLWCSIVYLAWCLWVLIFRARSPGDQSDVGRDLILFAIPTVMSVRALFGTNVSPLSSVPAVAYCFLVLCAAQLAIRTACVLYPTSQPRLGWPSPAPLVIALLMFGYVGARILASIGNAPTYSLETLAGPVSLRDDGRSGAVYQYIAAETGSQGKILELPYGGGIAFAAHRQSPVFSTQFASLALQDEYLREDVRRLELDPPAMVIAADGPRFGTQYGVSAHVACTFPQFVWSAKSPPFDPDYPIPLVSLIASRYYVVARFDKIVVMKLSAEPTEASSRR